MECVPCPRCKDWAPPGCALCCEYKNTQPWPAKTVPVAMAVEYQLSSGSPELGFDDMRRLRYRHIKAFRQGNT